ncbi:MAG: hypothetical protein FJZ16_07350 [Candidatus Omnitrophica bacterium]|nr:hypothetical protein [Candidatus Omnitrophota bacterium]
MKKKGEGFTPLEKATDKVGGKKIIDDSVSMPVRENSLTGFTYTVSKEQLDDYRKWPIERRLKWLFYGNKMRRFLPKKTIEIQELFRNGKI